MTLDNQKDLRTSPLATSSPRDTKTQKLPSWATMTRLEHHLTNGTLGYLKTLMIAKINLCLMIADINLCLMIAKINVCLMIADINL